MTTAARFGRFVLLETLGTGATGEVLLADDGGALRALKRLLPHLPPVGEAARVFEREAKVVARLAHPNIVRLYEQGEIDGVPYLLMEYVDGPSVHELLRRARALPPPAAAFVARELCRALAYVHRLRGDDGKPLALVHRDVSPSNVLVARDGSVKLCDFGIAKTTTSTATVPGFVKGKHGYRSPEQESGGALDGRSDVFAIGVVLFELLTGARARADERPSRRAAGIPPALDDACARALAADRAARFAGADEMVRALDTAADAGGAAALRDVVARLCPPRVGSEATRTRTLAPRRAGRRRIALALAAAGVVTVAWLATHRRTTSSPPVAAAPTLPNAPSPSPIAASPSPIAPSLSPIAPSLSPPPGPPPSHAASPIIDRSAARTRAKPARKPPKAHGSDYMPDPFAR